MTSFFERIKRLVSALAILGLIMSPVSAIQRPESAYAGDISSASWTLSSVATNATSVTYTHTFTTATAIPVNGFVEISIMQPPGPFMPMPDFKDAAVASGTTTGISTDKPAIFFAGPSLTMSFKATSAIAAGTVTVKLSGITNPSQGGIFQTNTVTLNSSFQPVDGQRFSQNPNGKLKVGLEKLNGKVADATSGTGVASYPLRVFTDFSGPGGPGSNQINMETTTDSSGNYSFVGLPNGNYRMEKGFVDPMNSNAQTINQYAPFESTQVTIGDTAVTKNINLETSKKTLKMKVVYDGTTTGVKGAQVFANVMGGGPGGPGEGPKGGGGMVFNNGQTNSSGDLELKLSGTGMVFVNVQPMQTGPQPQGGPGGPGGPGGQQQQNDTDFGSMSFKANFAKPSNETEVLDLGTKTVQKADATVNLTLKNSDGSAATGGAFAFDPKNHSGTPLFLQNGLATFKAISGRTLMIDAFDQNQDQSMPPNGRSFVAKKGTNTITITKVKNDKTVTMTAKRNDGGTERAVTNANAMVFPKEPGPPYFATSDSSGIATVKVPAGFEGGGFMNPSGTFGGGPKAGGPEGKLSVSAAPGDSTDTNQLFPITGFQRVAAGGSYAFMFGKADKRITATTDTTDGAFVEVMSVGGGGHFSGFPTAGGFGSGFTTAGKKRIIARFPPDSSKIGVAKEIDVTGDTTVALTTKGKTVTVKGSILDASNNNAVIKGDEAKTLDLMVGLFSTTSGFSGIGQIDTVNGTYTAKGAPGEKYFVGVAAGDPGMGVQKGGYVPNVNPKAVEGTGTETITHDVSLAKIDATVSGKVVKTVNGQEVPVEGAKVLLDEGFAEIVEGPGGPHPGPGGPGGPGPGGPEGPEFGFNDETNSDGKFSIDASAGIYGLIVEAKLLGLFDTSIGANRKIDLKSKQTLDFGTITLAAPDSTLVLDVNKPDNSDLAGGNATIYNDKGISVVIRDGEEGDKDEKKDGKITVDLVSGSYKAVVGSDEKLDQGIVYETPVTTINVEKDKTTTSTLTTGQQSTDALKANTTEVGDSAATVNIGTFANVAIPSGALSSSSSSSSESSSSSSSSSGNPVVTVSPADGELPRDPAVSTIGTGFVVSAVDGSGNGITSLQSSATLEATYKDSDVPAGTSESNLKLMAFNDSTGKYEPLQSSIVDTAANKIVATTTHFTDFAIVAATDTTAPAEATSITATGGKTKVTLGWTNPTDSDFDHLDIYRSENTSSIGDKVKTTAKADTSYEDTGLTNNKAYYYTFKSVDSTGNTSSGTDQVVGVPTASTKTLPKTGMIEGVNGVEGRSGRDGKWLWLLLPMALGAWVLRRKAVMG